MFSLEDMDETVVDTGPSIEDSAEETELMADNSDLTEDSAAIDEANDNIAVMERLIIKMEEAVESGDGFNEETAGNMDVVLEHIVNRLGVEYSGFMVSTEQFGSNNTRLAATKIALEDMKEKARAFWENLKKKVMEWWDKIRAFFSKLANMIAMKQRTYKGLTEKFNSIEDKVNNDKQKTFDSGSLSSAFTDGSKGMPKNVETYVKNASGALDHVAKIITSWSGKSAEQGISSTAGGKTVVFVGGDTMVDDKDTGTVYFVANKQPKKNTSSTCLAMTKGEVGQALKYIGALLEKATKFVAKDIDPVKASRNIIKEIDYYVKEAENDEQKEKFVADRKRIVAAANNIGSASKDAPTYALRTAVLAMAYVSNSMGAWELNKD